MPDGAPMCTDETLQSGNEADNEVEQMTDENQKFDDPSNEDDWEMSDFLSSDDSCDEINI